MKFIKNLKIRDKLLILLFILLIPLLIFVFSKITQELLDNRELKEADLRLTESQKISSFVHHFQKERARIMAAATGDSVFLVEARMQRKFTDASERDLKIFLEDNNRSFQDLHLVNDLHRYRSAVDEKKIDINEFKDYSNNLIVLFLNRIEDNAYSMNNPSIRRELLSFVKLVSLKIDLGKMRSLLMKGVSVGDLTDEEYGMFVSQKDSYYKNLGDFQRYASEEARQEIEKRIAGATYKEVLGVIQALEFNPQLKIGLLNPRNIFNKFTVTIEDVRESEDHLLSKIRSNVSNEIQIKERGLMVMISSIVVALSLATLLSIYIINLISSSLSSLKIASDQIMEGSTDVEITIDSKDEIGSLAKSFKGVVEKNVALTKVAQAIGEGRYDIPMTVKSERDILSNAIKVMKDNLYVLTKENEKRNWILTGVAELNNLVTGESMLDKLSEKIIAYVTKYTQSDAGIIYLNIDSGKLIPTACIGTDCSIEDIPAFAIGTGKIGQAVEDNTILTLENVPYQSLTIQTGFAKMDPVHILILPLVFADNSIGAIELTSRTPYHTTHIEFFESIAERISIMVHTLKTHLQTQQLLYETQNQAEELETQQEDLRQLNSELKASEEELKVSQEELQEKNSELEEKAQLLEEQFEAIRTKNKALEDAREAIELKIQQVETVSKYKSEFLANMSHELRTPLNSILILSRLLADNREKNLNEKQSEQAQIIHNSGSDLLKLINEILDLSKIESGQIKLDVQEVSVHTIKVEQYFKELAQNKNILFTVNFAADLYDPIKTDIFRLEQILKNFLSNAVKFTDKGGKVEMSVYPVKQKMNFASDTLREEKEIVAFSVKDNGIGISKEKQELIFEAFQQEDSSTTRRYGGTGLGLTISKELALLLGGEIKVESEPGKGSTFTLFLPRYHKQEIKKAPAPKEPLKSSKSEMDVTTIFEKISSSDKKEISVLIVEDDKGFSRILKDFALAKNFKVHQAYTGNEGFDMARQVQPDAILLDINLPDISGWEVLKKIREDKNLKYVNVHVMSAYDKEVNENYSGKEEYLPKPVTLEMLDKAFTNISMFTDKSIEKILIVEDNLVENKAISELLLAHNIQSVSAFSAEEAEVVLQSNKIDCIILDLNLPGVKGYEWMERVKSSEVLAGIPIIIYSGKDLTEEEEMRLKKFANTIIIKNEYSYIRLLDEVQLFLHKINQKLPGGVDFKMKLHVPEEILKGKKVLVVDDDVRNVYSLFSLLEMHGMQILVANDGKEAVEKLQSEKSVDIVLMDIMMPEMDGIEATRRIRKMEHYKDLPIIALTAKAMKGDKEKCISAGASDYIPKPVDTDKLLTLMRVWLYEG